MKKEIQLVKRHDIFVGEDDIVEFIESDLEYEMVDNGIGPYEFWGTPGNDVRIEPELSTQTVEIMQTADEDCILNKITGSYTTDEVDGDQQIDWVATLISCELKTVKVENGPDKYEYVPVYDCKFEVEGA